MEKMNLEVVLHDVFINIIKGYIPYSVKLSVLGTLKIEVDQGYVCCVVFQDEFNGLSTHSALQYDQPLSAVICQQGSNLRHISNNVKRNSYVADVSNELKSEIIKQRKISDKPAGLKKIVNVCNIESDDNNVASLSSICQNRHDVALPIHCENKQLTRRCRQFTSKKILRNLTNNSDFLCNSRLSFSSICTEIRTVLLELFRSLFHVDSSCNLSCKYVNGFQPKLSVVHKLKCTSFRAEASRNSILNKAVCAFGQFQMPKKRNNSIFTLEMTILLRLAEGSPVFSYICERFCQYLVLCKHRNRKYSPIKNRSTSSTVTTLGNNVSKHLLVLPERSNSHLAAEPRSDKVVLTVNNDVFNSQVSGQWQVAPEKKPSVSEIRKCSSNMDISHLKGFNLNFMSNKNNESEVIGVVDIDSKMRTCDTENLKQINNFINIVPKKEFVQELSISVLGVSSETVSREHRIKEENRSKSNIAVQNTPKINQRTERTKDLIILGDDLLLNAKLGRINPIDSKDTNQNIQISNVHSRCTNNVLPNSFLSVDKILLEQNTPNALPNALQSLGNHTDSKQEDIASRHSIDFSITSLAKLNDQYSRASQLLRDLRDDVIVVDEPVVDMDHRTSPGSSRSKKSPRKRSRTPSVESNARSLPLTVSSIGMDEIMSLPEPEPDDCIVIDDSITDEIFQTFDCWSCDATFNKPSGLLAHRKTFHQGVMTQSRHKNISEPVVKRRKAEQTVQHSSGSLPFTSSINSVLDHPIKPSSVSSDRLRTSSVSNSSVISAATERESDNSAAVVDVVDFTCKSCDAHFTLLADLVKHRTEAHNDGPMEPMKGNQSFEIDRLGYPSPVDLNDPMYDRLKKFQCPSCEASFTHPSNLKRHQKKSHGAVFSRKEASATTAATAAPAASTAAAESAAAAGPASAVIHPTISPDQRGGKRSIDQESITSNRSSDSTFSHTLPVSLSSNSSPLNTSISSQATAISSPLFNPANFGPASQSALLNTPPASMNLGMPLISATSPSLGLPLLPSLSTPNSLGGLMRSTSPSNSLGLSLSLHSLGISPPVYSLPISFLINIEPTQSTSPTFNTPGSSPSSSSPQDSPSPQASSSRSPRYRHTCVLCGLLFTFRTNLTRHMKKAHSSVPFDSIDLPKEPDLL